MRLLDTEDFAGLGLSEAPRLGQLVDLQHQTRLQQLLLEPFSFPTSIWSAAAASPDVAMVDVNEKEFEVAEHREGPRSTRHVDTVSSGGLDARKISVSSQVGVGSTFTFTLPLRDAGPIPG